MVTGATAESGPAEFTAATDDETGTLFQCPLCGLRFSHGGQVCGGCVLRSGCDLVSCPGCGYSFPRTSRLVEWVKRLLRRGRRGPP